MWLCDCDHDMWQFVTVTYDVMLIPNSKSKINKIKIK